VNFFTQRREEKNEAQRVSTFKIEFHAFVSLCLCVKQNPKTKTNCPNSKFGFTQHKETKGMKFNENVETLCALIYFAPLREKKSKN